MARPANHKDELQALRGSARASTLRYQRAYARWESMNRNASSVEEIMNAWKVCEMELKTSEETFTKLLRFQARRKAMQHTTPVSAKQEL